MAEDLAGLREAYDREDYHEDGAFSHDDMNAYHRAARALIAAQQQRIAELEKGLEPFAGIWRAWSDERVKPVPAFNNIALFMRYRVTSDPYENYLRDAYDLLRAEKGGEG